MRSAPLPAGEIIVIIAFTIKRIVNIAIMLHRNYIMQCTMLDFIVRTIQIIIQRHLLLQKSKHRQQMIKVLRDGCEVCMYTDNFIFKNILFYYFINIILNNIIYYYISFDG